MCPLRAYEDIYRGRPKLKLRHKLSGEVEATFIPARVYTPSSHVSKLQSPTLFSHAAPLFLFFDIQQTSVGCDCTCTSHDDSDVPWSIPIYNVSITGCRTG